MKIEEVLQYNSVIKSLIDGGADITPAVKSTVFIIILSGG